MCTKSVTNPAYGTHVSDDAIHVYTSINTVHDLLKAIAEVEGRPDPTAGGWFDEDEEDE